MLSALLLACAGEPPPDGDFEARRKALKSTLRELVGELGEAGRYDCCVQTPCSMCALRTSGCSCGEGLRDGEPVCEECALLWHEGKGAEPVDGSTVFSFLEAARREEARAKGQDVCGRPLPGAAP
ncbi:MAG: hypothetical protein ACOZNI_19535 [Myxococcota bacterium]